MSLDVTAIDAALTTALPVLYVTAYPVLIATIGVGIWWLRQPTPTDDYNIDDYRPATTTARATAHRPAVDDRTQVIARVMPDGGTPLYDQLAAKHTAREWLRDIAANRTFVNGVNEGGAL